MKNLASETIRLMQAALECRDALRRLAARIQAANTPESQAEVLKAAYAVATVNAELLKTALKDNATRRHSTVSREAQPLWAITREAR